MSMNPALGLTTNPVDPSASLNPAPPSARAKGVEPACSTNLETGPNQEFRRPQSESANRETPTDEVQVQRDEQTSEIVIKYLDGSGGLILQVPSPQVLNLARAIEQHLQQVTANRENERDAGDEGGNARGH